MGRRLTILLVADPFMRVGDDAVGGAEQILAILERGASQAGHRTLVIAAEGSHVSGELIPSPAGSGHWDGSPREAALAYHFDLIRKTLARYSIDLIHMHGQHFYRYLPAQIPTLITLHLPGACFPEHAWNAPPSNVWLNCVSESQSASFSHAPWIANGVDVPRFNASPAKRNFALALGRICPEKGFHFAIDAAKRAAVDLRIAGRVFPYEWHEQYFSAEIAPRLDARRRFIGPIQFTEKRCLLAEAKCLLIPSTVAETSSLVAMEALASGTPVIAFGSGALPEIVEHGRTGFIVGDVWEMAEAISQTSEIDPAACRRAAESRFRAESMIDAYLDLYGRIAGKT